MNSSKKQVKIDTDGPAAKKIPLLSIYCIKSFNFKRDFSATGKFALSLNK